MEKEVYTNDNESKPICDVCGKEFDVEDLNGAYSGECLCPSCAKDRVNSMILKIKSYGYRRN